MQMQIYDFYSPHSIENKLIHKTCFLNSRSERQDIPGTSTCQSPKQIWMPLLKRCGVCFFFSHKLRQIYELKSGEFSTVIPQGFGETCLHDFVTIYSRGKQVSLQLNKVKSKFFIILLNISCLRSKTVNWQ